MVQQMYWVSEPSGYRVNPNHSLRREDSQNYRTYDFCSAIALHVVISDFASFLALLLLTIQDGPFEEPQPKPKFLHELDQSSLTIALED